MSERASFVKQMHSQTMKGISVRIVHHVLLEHVSEARKAVEVAEFLEISGNS